MRLVYLPLLWTVVADVVIWFLLHMGIAVSLASVSMSFNPSRGWFKPWHWERDGTIYPRVFRTRRWVGYVPDGAWLLGHHGFPKKRLAATNAAYYWTFARETCRAEVTHWLIAACAPLFFLWNPPTVGVLMILYALGENLPIIMVQRYNRARLLRVLRKLDSANALRGRSPR